MLLLWALRKELYIIPKATSKDRLDENLAALAMLYMTSNTALGNLDVINDFDLAELNKLECDQHFCWNPSRIL